MACTQHNNASINPLLLLALIIRMSLQNMNRIPWCATFYSFHSHYDKIMVADLFFLLLFQKPKWGASKRSAKDTLDKKTKFTGRRDWYIEPVHQKNHTDWEVAEKFPWQMSLSTFFFLYQNYFNKLDFHKKPVKIAVLLRPNFLLESFPLER